MGFEPGAIIGSNLRLVRMLAKGGMGSVWVAEHLRLKTQVAVKLIADILSFDPTVQKRFAFEAEAAAQIRSPHVVQILDHGTTDGGTSFIVMELLEGETLGNRILRVGRLALDETTAILAQTSKALARAHSLGFVHRDIKPDNVFLTESNDELFVKVLDFGIVKRREDKGISMTRSGAALGTPRYMSPEQLVNAKHVTPGADLWSLAAVAYRALMGRPPFDGDSFAAIGAAVSRGIFQPPSEVRRDLPRALDIWFRRALDVKRIERFSSAREFAETFARAAGLPPNLVVPARLPSGSSPPFEAVPPPVVRPSSWPARGSTHNDSDDDHRTEGSIAPASVPNGVPRGGVAQGVRRGIWIAGTATAAVVAMLVLGVSGSLPRAASTSAPAASPSESVAGREHDGIRDGHDAPLRFGERQPVIRLNDAPDDGGIR
jgi:serine/threonine protein kinase